MTLSQRKTNIILLLIIALAAFLRLWQLDTLPPGLYHDEAYNGLDALSLLQGKTFPQFYEGWELYAQDAHANNLPQESKFPLFFEGNYGREPVHIYLMALSIKILGATPFGIRAVPAFAGILAVFTTYLAATQLTAHDNKMAKFAPLGAAFMMAILFPAIHFSRFGLRAMVFVPVETMAVYFFWRGVNGTKRNICFGVAGFLLGMGLYIYAAARLFPLLFVLFVLIWFWKERGALRLFWQPVSLMAGVSLLTAVPLLVFFIQYPYFFIFRIAYVANKGKGAVEGKVWLTWLLNIWRTLRGLFWLGETHLRHNLPGRPYLDPIQAILFSVGIIYTALQKLNLRTIFLFLWLIIMLLPTILSGDAPHFGRMTGAAPVIAIFIGVGVSMVSGQWSVVSKRLSVSNRRQFAFYFSLITVFCLFLSLFLTGRDYFGRYASHPQLAADFYLPDWQLGKFAAAQPPDSTLYLSPTQEELATIYFALADPAKLQNYSGNNGAIPAGIANQPALYLLRPEETAVLQTLQTTFPEGNLIATPNDSFVAFALPAAAPRMNLVQETAVSFAEQISLIGWSATMEDGQLSVWLAWRAKQPLALNYTAFVHLLGQDGHIVAQLDKPPSGYPTSDWHEDEIVLDLFTLPLPTADEQQADPLTLQTGFYYLPTLIRLGEPFVLTPNLTLPVEQ